MQGNTRRQLGRSQHNRTTAIHLGPQSANSESIGEPAMRPIYAHQTLHGYGDGHQLLASSIDLPTAQSSALLVMSDLSGPGFRRGYESYLTGYPLGGAGVYCIARTWFAPELSRPGCVWTHSILL